MQEVATRAVESVLESHVSSLPVACFLTSSPLHKTGICLSCFLPCSTCVTVSLIFFRWILFISRSGTRQFKPLVSGFFAMGPVLDSPAFGCSGIRGRRILLILTVQKDRRASSSPPCNSVTSVRPKSTKHKRQLLHRERGRITGLPSAWPRIT